MNCKFCKSNQVRILKKVNDYNLFYCTICKSEFFFIASNHELTNFYEQLVQRDIVKCGFKKSIYWRLIRSRLIRMQGGKVKSILDIGCRQGDFLLHFSPNIIREGVEVSSSFAKIASYRGLKIHVNLFENINFSRKYEVVSAFNILEHIYDFNYVIEKAADLVESDGLFVMEIPTHQCIKVKVLNFLNIKWFMYIPPEHLNFPSRMYLDKVMKAKGFILLKRWYTSGLIINPFKNIPILSGLFKGIMFLFDLSFSNRFPIFEHMYSIYRKTKN